MADSSENRQDSAENAPHFRWSKAKDEAAVLVAHDELTNAEIAKRLNVGERTLYTWQSRPEFQARVEEHAVAVRRRIRANGISVIENRVRHLQRRHELMNRVIAERAADPAMAAVPGGGTGLMVHNVKSIGSGEFAERVDLYEVDAGLLKELREHERQVAQELGQWMEKHDHTTDGKPFMVKVLSGVSMDDL